MVDILIINLVSIGLLGLLVASLFLWIIILLKLTKRAPAYEQTFQKFPEIAAGLRFIEKRSPLGERKFRSTQIPIPEFAAILGVLWVGLNISMKVYSQFLSPVGQPEFNADQVYEGAEAQIMVNLMVVLVFGLSIIFGVKKIPDWIRLGFRTDELFGQVKDGILAFIVSIVPVYAVIFITVPLRTEEAAHPLLRLISERGIGPEFFVIAFAALVTAPLWEELVFRVVLQSWLVNSLGVIWGIAITASIFAAVHGFPDMLALIPLSLLFGIMYDRRRSYIANVVTHALFNALNLVLVLFQRYAANVIQEHQWFQ